MCIRDSLFAAALLQDMAIPLLLKELPEHYEGLIERRGQEPVSYTHLTLPTSDLV